MPLMAANSFSLGSTRGSIALPTNVNTQPCVQVTVLRVYVFACTCLLMPVTAEHSSARFGNCGCGRWFPSKTDAQISPKPKWESFAVLLAARLWWDLQQRCSVLALERSEGVRLSMSSVARWRCLCLTNFNKLHRKHGKRNRRGNHWMYN